MTYIYVKQNLSFMPSASQALLKAFLESLYKGEYADYCVEVFGFTRVDGEALRVAGDAILSLNVTGTPFTFESEEDTLPIDGQGDYIISGKRSSAVEVEFDRLDVSNQQVEQRVRELETRLTQALEVLNLMEQNNAGIGGGGETSSSSSNNQAAAFTDEETKDAEIAAALALSIISIIFSAVIGLGLLCRHFAGGHENKRDLESPH